MERANLGLRRILIGPASTSSRFSYGGRRRGCARVGYVAARSASKPLAAGRRAGVLRATVRRRPWPANAPTRSLAATAPANPPPGFAAGVVDLGAHDALEAPVREQALDGPLGVGDVVVALGCVMRHQSSLRPARYRASHARRRACEQHGEARTRVGLGDRRAPGRPRSAVQPLMSRIDESRPCWRAGSSAIASVTSASVSRASRRSSAARQLVGTLPAAGALVALGAEAVRGRRPARRVVVAEDGERRPCAPLAPRLTAWLVRMRKIQVFSDGAALEAVEPVERRRATSPARPPRRPPLARSPVATRSIRLVVPPRRGRRNARSSPRRSAASVCASGRVVLMARSTAR